MANRFNLVAQLQLNGPGNVRAVVAQINRQLTNIRASVNVQVSTRTLSSIRTLNSTLSQTTQLLQSASTSSAQLRANLASLAQTAGATNTQVNQLNRNASALNQTMGTINRNASLAGNSMFNFGRNSAQAIKKFGSFTIVTSGIIGLTVGIRSAIKEAVEFQNGLVRLSQITGTSTKNLGGLADEITRLSTSLGVSSKDLLEVSDTLAQAGLTIGEVKVALEALAKTKLAPTFGDIKNTVEATIASMRQFKIPVEDLKTTLGSFNAVAAAFAVEADDISTAVRRSGAAFQAAGGNLDEFIALFTSVRQTTREGAETIATGFRTIFTRLQRPKTLDFLRSLGVELIDLKGQFVGPYEAVRRLSSALQDIESTDPRFAGIVEELGGFRQVSKVIPLLQQFAVAENALAVARRGRTSLDRDAITAQESMLVQLTKLKERFFDLFRTMGNNSSIQSFLSLSLKLANSLVSIAEALTPLIPLFASLGAIKLGSGLISFGRGFGSGLRTPNRFAEGGMVPGTGNGDTVPALLTPGEYVLPKHVVQSIGMNKFGKAKFAKGGKIKKFADGGKVFGLAALYPEQFKNGTTRPIGETTRADSVDLSKINPLTQETKSRFGIGNAKNYSYKLVAATISNKVKENFDNNLYKDLQQTVQNQANNILPLLAPGANYKSQNLDKFGFKSMSGNIFEAALASVGPPYTKENNAQAFDFPQGLQNTAQALFNAPSLTSNPTDAKRTYNADSITDIDKKVFNYISSENLKTLDSRQKKSLNTKLSSRPVKRAEGGSITGFGEDTVPAMLTPGEFVLDKGTAKSIGYGNLERIRKYNKGGLVQRFATGGQVAAVGGIGLGAAASLIYILPQITSGFGDMGDQISNAVTKIAALSAIVAVTGKSFTGLQPGALGALLGKGDVFGNRFSRASRLAGGGGVLAAGVGAGFSASAGIAATIYADSISKAPERRINAGVGTEADAQTLQKASVLSSVGTYAGIGAGVGAGVGASVGTLFFGAGAAPGAAIGALGGSLIGAVTGLFAAGTDKLEEARQAIRSKDFSLGVESLNESLSKVLEGKASLDGNKAKVADEIAKIQNKLSSTTGAERQESLSEASKSAEGLTAFANKLAAGTTSLEEFRNSSGGLGRQLIYTIASISELPVSEIEQQFANSIKAAQNSANVQKKISLALLNIYQDTRFVNNLSTAFDDAARAMQSFATQADVINSNFETISFNKDVSGTLSKGISGNPDDVKSALAQLFGSTDTGGLSDRLGTSVEEFKRLPDILRQALAEGQLSTQGGDNSGLGGAVESQLDGFPKELREIVMANLDNFLADEGGPGKFNKAVIENAEEFATELAEGSQIYFDALSKAAQVAQTETSKIVALVQSRTQYEANIKDSRVGLSTLRNSIRRQRGAIGDSEAFKKAQEPTSSTEARDIRDAQDVRLRGIKGVGRFSSAADIGSAAAERQDTILKNSAAIQNASLNFNDSLSDGAGSVKQLSEETQKAQSEYKQLVAVLRDQATNTKVLTALQNELGKAEQTRLGKKGLATELAFAGRDGREAFGKDLALTGVLSRNINAIGSSEQEGKVLQTLDKLISSGAGDIGVFNGRSANDLKNDRTRAFLTGSNSKGGLGLTEQQANEIINTSNAEKELQGKVVDAQISMEKAQQELLTLEREQLGKLNQNIEVGFAETVAAFNNSVANAKGRAADASISGIKGRQAENDAKRNAFNDLASPEIGVTREQAKIIENTSSVFVDLQNQLKNRDKLNSISTGGIGSISAESYRSVRDGASMIGSDATTAERHYNNAFHSIFDGLIGDAKQVQDIFQSEVAGKGLTEPQIEQVIKNTAAQFASNNQSFENTNLRNNIDASIPKELVDALQNNPRLLQQIIEYSRIIGDSTIDGIRDTNKELNALLLKNEIEKENVVAELKAIKDLLEAQRAAAGMSRGGIVYASTGTVVPGVNFKPKGTDTIPAMLTAGEAVLNKGAAKALGYGNINKINTLYASGGFPNNGAAGTAMSQAGNSVISFLSKSINHLVTSVEKLSTNLLKSNNGIGVKNRTAAGPYANVTSTGPVQGPQTEQQDKRQKFDDDIKAKQKEQKDALEQERKDRQAAIAQFAANKKAKEEEARNARIQSRKDKGLVDANNKPIVKQTPKAAFLTQRAAQVAREKLQEKDEREADIKNRASTRTKGQAGYIPTAKDREYEREKAKYVEAGITAPEGSVHRTKSNAHFDEIEKKRREAEEKEITSNKVRLGRDETPEEQRDRKTARTHKLRESGQGQVNAFNRAETANYEQIVKKGKDTSAANDLRRQAETDAYVANLPAASNRNRANMAETRIQQDELHNAQGAMFFPTMQTKASENDVVRQKNQVQKNLEMYGLSDNQKYEKNRGYFPEESSAEDYFSEATRGYKSSPLPDGSQDGAMNFKNPKSVQRTNQSFKDTVSSANLLASGGPSLSLPKIQSPILQGNTVGVGSQPIPKPAVSVPTGPGFDLGGLTKGIQQALSSFNTKDLTAPFNKFEESTNKLVDMASKWATDVTFKGAIEPIQVMINGTQVFGELEQKIVNMINSVITQRIPGAPPASPQNESRQATKVTPD